MEVITSGITGASKIRWEHNFAFEADKVRRRTVSCYVRAPRLNAALCLHQSTGVRMNVSTDDTNRHRRSKRIIKTLMIVTIALGIGFSPVAGYIVSHSSSVPDPLTGRVHRVPVKYGGPAYVTEGQSFLVKGLGLGPIVLGILAVVLNSRWRTKCF